MRNRRAAIYLRVSTGHQDTENQALALRDAASRAGWDVVQVYEDKGFSGAKTRSQRPALNDLMSDVREAKVDVIMAWSVDRLGRSLQDLLGFLSDIQRFDVDLYLQQQGIDTTTPAGKAMFQMCGVFAEFERAMIQDRIKAGLVRARASGKRLGRPTVSEATELQIRNARTRGIGILRIAKELSIGVSTVQRVLAGH